ncbi:MAG: transporter permease protein [Myxococcaceae bacterium]|nr:transporter permease protein [Myxococcaceae bacterium]
MTMTQGVERPAIVRTAHAKRDKRRSAAARLGPGPRIPYALAIGPTLLLLAWILCTELGWVDPRILSTPGEVASRSLQLLRDGRLLSNLLTSATRALAGLGIGLLVGGGLGLLAGLSRVGEALVDGTIQAKRAIPTLALIPLLILWFGIGEEMKILTIAIAVSLQMYLHTHTGLRAVDMRYVELAESLRLSRWKFVRKVALPSAVPEFVNGLRHAIAASWLVLVAVEQINATSGVGHMMSLARSYGQTEIIVVGLLVYGAFGLISDALVRQLERRALSWRRVLAA